MVSVVLPPDVLSSHFYSHGTDTDIVRRIFLSGFQGDVVAVRELVDSFNMGPGYYLRPLMEIAAAEGDSQLLRICFEKGFLGTSYLDSEYLLLARVRSNPSTAWLDVLYESDFCQWRTDPQQLSKQRTWFYLLFMGADCTRWWIEHGGRASNAQGIFEAFGNAERWLGARTVRVLLDQFGVDWFNDSGTLQLAVKKHDFGTVKMLVEAGADVNEFPTEWRRDFRDNRAAPLPALHQAIFAKSESMVRYLAEHGAKLTRGELDISDPCNKLPKEYWVLRDLVVELGAIKEESSP